MTGAGFGHVPVMLGVVLEHLQPRSGGLYVDGTLGGGGHAEAILAASGPDGRLIGFDKDPEAIAAAGQRLAPFGDRFTAVHGDFKGAAAWLRHDGIPGIDGALLDLGVSSFQLDNARRGFSYSADAPLDMRMDPGQDLSARQVVNQYPQRQLQQLIFGYGEERWASRIAQFIVAARQRTPIETTGQLVEIILAAIPASARREGPHPAKRTFQALRIEVNGELTGLDDAVEELAELLNPGGRLCVITFHSLEDRLVKTAMRAMEHPCTCPPSAPICTCGRVPLGRAVPRRAIAPDAGEVVENPRSRSAKVRVFVRRSNQEKE